MTDKVIQLNIDELRKTINGISSSLKMIQNYQVYSGYIDKFRTIRTLLDEQKLISASEHIQSLENNFENIHSNFTKLRELLKQGGCEFD